VNLSRTSSLIGHCVGVHCFYEESCDLAKGLAFFSELYLSNVKELLERILNKWVLRNFVISTGHFVLIG
jgi:hypothetical protein